VKNSLWKRLWTCRKTEYVMMMMMMMMMMVMMMNSKLAALRSCEMRQKICATFENNV